MFAIIMQYTRQQNIIMIVQRIIFSYGLLKEIQISPPLSYLIGRTKPFHPSG